LAVFQGERLRGIDLRTGKLVRSYPKSPEVAGFDEDETGRGLICGTQVLVPQSTKIARIDLEREERAADIPLAAGMRDSGTLLYVGTDLITVNPQRMSVFTVVDP